MKVDRQQVQHRGRSFTGGELAAVKLRDVIDAPGVHQHARDRLTEVLRKNPDADLLHVLIPGVGATTIARLMDARPKLRLVP